jgi:hypothetical protein
MKFLRRTAGGTGVGRESNTRVMKELNTEPTTNFIQTYRANWKRQVLGIPVQQLHFKRYVINEKGKDPQEDPSSDGMRP